MKKGLRIKLLNDFKVGDNYIKKDTVGTILDIFNDIVFVRYNNNKLIGVPINQLIELNETELKEINYELVSTDKYRIGKEYLKKDSEEKFTITNIILNKFENLDIIEVKNNKNETFKFSREIFNDEFTSIDEYLIYGNEIDLTNAKVTRIFPGLKVMVDENMYIVKNIKDNKVICINNEGEIHNFDEDDVITFSNISELLQKFNIHCFPQYEIGSQYVMIKNNMLINDIKIGDVVTIVGYDEIDLNSYEDIFIVKCKDKEIKLSLNDFELFFEKINTHKKPKMIKQISGGKIESVQKTLLQNDQIEDDIQIKSVMINGNLFDINGDEITSKFSINNLEKYIESLYKLKKIINKN
jgi:hypothetical protein